MSDFYQQQLDRIAELESIESRHDINDLITNAKRIGITEAQLSQVKTLDELRSLLQSKQPKK